jgi:hypothetical protein
MGPSKKRGNYEIINLIFFYLRSSIISITQKWYNRINKSK